MMTYDQLVALACSGDRLIDADRPDSYRITADGLIIDGAADECGSYQSDMRIVIEPGGFRVWLRDPKDLNGTPCFHGAAWSHERFCPTYSDLTDWVYSW